MQRWIRAALVATAVAVGGDAAAEQTEPLETWAEVWGLAMAVARQCEAEAPHRLVRLARGDLQAMLRRILPEAPLAAHEALATVWVERMHSHAQEVVEQMAVRPPDCARELGKLDEFVTDVARNLRNSRSGTD